MKNINAFDLSAPGTSDNTTIPPTTEPLNGAGRATDPFDPISLQLSQNPLAATDVKKALIRVPVRRPSPQEYIRVHPGEDYRLTPQ